VRSRAVSHVGHTLGYRIESDGQVLAYIPDHQMPLDGHTIGDGVLELCDGADLVLHDAQYSDAEFERKSNWGHSTAGYAVRVAAAAGARRLKFIHHDPYHDDDDIDRLVADARRLPEARRLEEISAAAEGGTVDLAAG
jgi:ribonuclease BN (tRNA processing enzyme)